MQIQNILSSINIGSLMPKGMTIKEYLKAHAISSFLFFSGAAHTVNTICLGIAAYRITGDRAKKQANRTAKMACIQGIPYLFLGSVFRFANQIPPLRGLVERLPTSVKPWIS